MFVRLASQDRDGSSEQFEMLLDERRVHARPGDSVAAVILAAGEMAVRRSSVSAAPRAPYCLMGVCFECLVTIDGEPGQQACMVLARPGMVVHLHAGRTDNE